MRTYDVAYVPNSKSLALMPEVDELDLLEEVFNGNYYFDDRAMLDVQLLHNGKPLYLSRALNDATYADYLNRFRRIATSMFEWVNLPKTMNSRYLELCLYYNGKAALLKDKKYGFINTKCAGTGYVNIYGLPTSINCFSLP